MYWLIFKIELSTIYKDVLIGTHFKYLIVNVSIKIQVPYPYSNIQKYYISI